MRNDAVAETGRSYREIGSEGDCDEKTLGLLGRSGPMEALRRLLRRVGPCEVGVHVFGETGSGKERVARAIHALSRRSRRPFVAVNAAALGDNLFESELFGHSRGAFTGAVSEKRGLLAEAEGGTLFIDEVVDLSPAAQVKLLRVLQEKEYRRLGESALRRADVRIVTAANRALGAEAAQGRFREDLLYRLTTVEVRVPPLRERADDALLLAQHFLAIHAAREGRSAPALSVTAMDALRDHAWPGNVRELENEMARLVVVGGPVVEVVDLRSEITRAASGESGRQALRARVASFERDVIAQELARTGGRRSDVARLLGISRQALHAKLRRLAER